MRDAIKTKHMGPVTVNILPDTFGDHECPLDTLTPDEGIRFVTFENRSVLTGPPYNEFSSPSEAKAFAKKNRYEVFPLYKYEHGLVRYEISTNGNPFYGRLSQGHAEFDSGQTGYILIKKSAWQGSKRRFEIAESWCKAITTWCNGDYYGFVIEDEEGNHLDSCWGFDDADYCEQEAVAIAKHYVEEINDRKASEAEESRPDMYQGA